MPIPDNIYLYRIIHIDNLEYILDLGKLTCSNHSEKDLNYVGIGDSTLIQSRAIKRIDLEPYGTFLDYISFYFGNRSPMLFNIHRGFKNVIQREQKDIIYLVSSYKKIKESGIQFVFFDGHGFDKYSIIYNDDNGLNQIDWQMVNSKFWHEIEEDPDRKRRKQAELLVYHELSLDYILGIGVYNNKIKEEIDSFLIQKSIFLKCKVKKEWYY